MSTKISLQLETKHDLELLEKNIDCRIIRLYGTVMFRTASGASQPYKAIIDTGSPVSLIPKFIWKSIKFDVLSHNEFTVRLLKNYKIYHQDAKTQRDTIFCQRQNLSPS